MGETSVRLVCSWLENATWQEDIVCLLKKWKKVARGICHESVLDPVLHSILLNELHDIDVLSLEGEPPL